jgi:hypothetical protein
VLKIENNNYIYFKLNKEKAKYFLNDSINLLKNIKDCYSSYEIEDILLNNFEDLSYYWREKIVDIDYIRDGYGFYIESIYENEEIKKFFEYLKNDDPQSDYYAGFKELFKELKKESDAK